MTLFLYDKLISYENSTRKWYTVEAVYIGKACKKTSSNNNKTTVTADEVFERDCFCKGDTAYMYC